MTSQHQARKCADCLDKIYVVTAHLCGRCHGRRRNAKKAGREYVPLGLLPQHQGITPEEIRRRIDSVPITTAHLDRLRLVGAR